MAILTVLNTADSGAGSLRDLIAAASDGDTITFDASLAGSTINLQSELFVDKPIAIDGDLDDDGRPDITLSGDANGDDATTTDGFGNTITDVFSNTNTEDNVRVIFLDGDGWHLNGLVITGGVTPESDGPESGFGRGGGLYTTYLEDIGRAPAEVSITDSSISGNVAEKGGGFYNAGTDFFVIEGSVIAGNTAESGGGAGVPAQTFFVDTVVSDNYASDNGGGIFSEGGLPIVINSLITGNSTGGRGGGLDLLGGISYIVNTTITGNTAAYGGGIGANGDDPFIHSTTITGNFAAGEGGGIYFDPERANSSELYLYNSLVLANFAEGDANLSTGAIPINVVEASIVTAIDPTLIFETVAENPDTGVITGVLADNGGPVWTIALKADPSNPALDAGEVALPSELDLNDYQFEPWNVDVNKDGFITDDEINVDARGLARDVDLPVVNNGGTKDLGAYELQAEDFPFDYEAVSLDPSITKYKNWGDGFRLDLAVTISEDDLSGDEATAWLLDLDLPEGATITSGRLLDGRDDDASFDTATGTFTKPDGAESVLEAGDVVRLSVLGLFDSPPAEIDFDSVTVTFADTDGNGTLPEPTPEPDPEPEAAEFELVKFKDWGSGFRADFRFTVTEDLLDGATTLDWALDIDLTDGASFDSGRLLHGLDANADFDLVSGTFTSNGSTSAELEVGDVVELSILGSGAVDPLDFVLSFEDLA